MLLCAAAVLLAVMLLLAQGWRHYQEFLAAPLVVPPEGAVLEIERGMSGQQMVRVLLGRGITREEWTWRLLMRIEPGLMQAGEYRIEAGYRPRDLLGKLARGEVIQYLFTIVEGWTFHELLLALAAEPLLTVALDPEQPQAWLDAMPDPPAHPEGWFLPETYSYTREDDAIDILVRAHEAMRAELESAWSGRGDNLPLKSPYELLVLASLVEKETALDKERPQVSGVFVRRLQIGMRLQTDPTVIYGLGADFDGNLRRGDLEADTPYNTYTRHGLPPTPIAMPGPASLQAAAHPAAGDTLYFVADGTGGHTFSKTLAEHQRAVEDLVRRQR